MLRPPNLSSSSQTIEQFNLHFAELIELCEDYWYILRAEVLLFSKIPQMMFTQAKDRPLIEPLTKSFCLQVITVSLLGYLVSNQDFSYVEAHF